MDEMPQHALLILGLGAIASAVLWALTRKKFPSMKYDVVRLLLTAIAIAGVVIDWGFHIEVVVAWPLLFSKKVDAGLLPIFWIGFTWLYLTGTYFMAVYANLVPIDRILKTYFLFFG